MKLSKEEYEIFMDCRLHCAVCMLDGGCHLQKRYKKAKNKSIEKRKTRNGND